MLSGIVGRLFGAVTGSWWGLLAVGAIGAASGAWATTAADGAFFHGPRIAGLEKKVGEKDRALGKAANALASAAEAIKDRDKKLRALGSHEAAAATTAAGACNGEIARALSRGIAIGKAACRVRTPQ